MLFWGDPVTPAEEFRYITTHMLLPILGVVAGVTALTVILIVVLARKKKKKKKKKTEVNRNERKSL